MGFKKACGVIISKKGLLGYFETSALLSVELSRVEDKPCFTLIYL